MTTHTAPIVLAATTTNQYHDFIASFLAALIAVGLTQTADTGQVDLSQPTVPFPLNYSPNSIGLYCQDRDYHVFKMSAAGLPDIYLRFDYGVTVNIYNQNGAANFPYVQMRVGFATDGAGNLTLWNGVVGVHSFQSRQGYEAFSGSNVASSLQPSGDPQDCDFATDGQNYLSIMLGENAPVFEGSSLFVLGFERTIDATAGVYDQAGAVGFNGTGSTTTWCYLDLASQLEHNGNTSMPSICPPFRIGTADSKTVYTFPFIGSTIIPKGAPTVGMAFYNANVNVPLEFQATLYQSAHNYKCNPRSNVGADPYNTGSRIALRFD
jgi:hypothetical protein